MYFDVSERIALETNIPRTHIEKVDEFLAGSHIYRFELRQLQEKTHISDASDIIEQYVRYHVLSKREAYQCPNHNIILEKRNRSEGFCIECDDIHPFEDCSIITIYERRQKPDRYRSDSKVLHLKENMNTPWYKDIKFMLQTTIGILGVVATIGAGFLSINYIRVEVFTDQPTPIIEPTTPDLPATGLATSAIPSTEENDITQTPTAEITPDIEITDEIETNPTSDR